MQCISIADVQLSSALDLLQLVVGLRKRLLNIMTKWNLKRKKVEETRNRTPKLYTPKSNMFAVMLITLNLYIVVI